MTSPTVTHTITLVDPAPLALGGFAGATFLLSWVNAGLIEEPALNSAIATAWVFGGAIQILVGFWHLRNNQLFPAVTFGSYGAFWLSFSLFGTFSLAKIPATMHGTATALFLAPWAVFTLYMLVGSLRTNRALVLAFALVEATLIPLVIGNAFGSEAAIRMGGWFGLALSVEVWYIASAEIINHQFGRVVLPLGPLNSNGERE